MGKAPRQPSRVLHALSRGALLALGLLAGGAATAQTCSIEATYSEETSRYAHGVLGDTLEPTRLTYTLTPNGEGARCGAVEIIELARPYVFEDIAPRLVELTGDSLPEVITVRSHEKLGAQLAIYGMVRGELKLIAQTPHIGQRNRWLAPIGAADFDGDGFIEIGLIDRPHLAKTLRLWRFKRGKLREVAKLQGLTNHQIGWDFITSGLRDCGQGPEMITADAGWQHIMATRFDGTTISSRRIGAYKGPESIAHALSCPS